ncbi:MAG: hypothetical protein HPY53_05255 [Brevinematales bacterium]|nr:hypothetical protein [Brevinematales bacterium]
MTHILLKQMELVQKKLYKKAGNNIRSYFDILKETVSETEKSYQKKFIYQKLTKDKI